MTLTWFTNTFVFLRVIIDNAIRIGITIVVFIALLWFANRLVDAIHLMLMIIG